jgi:hypothetical protein
MVMTNDELDLKLLKGSTIVFDGLKIKPLLLGDIIDETNSSIGIGYDKYTELINILGVTKSSLVNATKEQLDEIQTFDIFVANKDMMDLLIQFLKIFLNYDNIKYLEEQHLILVDYDDYLACIHRENYDSIIKIFKKMYCISTSKKEEEYNPANDKARELIERIKKNNIAFLQSLYPVRATSAVTNSKED